MNEINEPLTGFELEALDRFLLDRFDEGADTEGKDEGILNVSELDGLVTAVVSGPESIMPSQWLPAVWGDFEPVWDDIEEYQKIFSLFMRHMNSTVDTLMSYAEEFEPIFFERSVEGKNYLIVDEWCEGYARGVALASSQWAAGGNEVTKLLAPILAFTEQMAWQGHDYEISEVERLQQAIAPSARKLHAFWLGRRQPPGFEAPTAVRSEPRVGRNDPCPCGSGKKYKRCCLQ